MDELAACVGDALGVPAAEVAAKVEELRSDDQLRDELDRALSANPKRDDRARYGYRYIYYCIARLRRPRLVVEVGTHDGLGAAILLRALERNAGEGSDGRLVTLDSNPAAGWLIPERLRGGGELVAGDVTETLGRVLDQRGCDFLIDDIGFAYEAKPALFEAGLGRAEGGIVIASEFRRREAADPPTELAAFAAERGGRYAEFNEDPERHFWPGHAQAVALFGAEAAGGR